ncbi:phage tail tape measure protein [Neobacillus sp. 19]|uniref:phage tail tape measure protein n=1 Tax=Neobacillus sp. 19 TaxID=3394458 RepID=UPI003BF6D38B
MNVGNIQATLTLNTAQFNQSMQQAQNQMSNTSNSAQTVSKDIKLIQKASLAMGAALVAGVGAAVKTAADFEQKMADVKAVSGATSSEMSQLTELAKEMGRQTAFSASEAAGGIEELIKAGLDIETIINGGLEGALNLAIAGSLNLGEAAEIASTALNSFKADALSVSDAANILAGAANASATDVREMKFGLSMVSAVASGVGLTFKDTATALATFAQNGLKGSDAGTSLKTMLLNLSPSTKAASEQMAELGLLTEKGTSLFYDANGSIKSMSEIAELLKTKLAKLSDEQRQMALKTMFGTDAIRAANILYKEGAKGIDEMWSAMSKVKAVDVARVKMETLKGAFIQFQSTLESVGIGIGEEFLPALTDITKFATGLIRQFGEVDKSTIKVGLAMAGTTTAILLVGSTIAKLSVALRAFALTPVGAAITALSILGGVIAGVVVHSNEMKEVNLETAESLLKQADGLGVSINRFDELKTKSKLTNDEFARFVDINSSLSKTADPEAIAMLTKEQDKLREKSGLSNEELDTMVQLNNDLIETVPEASRKISEQGNVILESTDKVKAYNQQQYERVRLELEAQKAKAEANMGDLLRKEAEELRRINGIKESLAGFDDKEFEQRKKIGKLYESLATAKKNNDALEIDRINAAIEREEYKIGAIKKQRAEAAGLLVDRTKELDKIQEQIGKLDEVKRKMIDLELRQVGLTSKRGEEVAVIDTAIAKLEEQKKKLHDSIPINQRNTAEYRESVSAIQSQIDKLQGTKSKVEEIIAKAQAMNNELAKDVTKWVNVYVQEQARHSSVSIKKNALEYHTGGIVGKPPKLHTGGLASQFANLPTHNEVDVRLLRNEMVLTEAQQANLMRMIDAGITDKSAGLSDSDRELLSLLRDIRSNTGKGVNATVIMDEREVGRIIEPYVTEEQALNKSRRERF